MSKYKNRSGYDRQLHQYITEYEDIEDTAENNENDDEFDQFFNNLALEAKSAKNEFTFAVKATDFDFINMFFTSFGKLQNTESVIVINLFADNVHVRTPIYKISQLR